MNKTDLYEMKLNKSAALVYQNRSSIEAEAEVLSGLCKKSKDMVKEELESRFHMMVSILG